MSAGADGAAEARLVRALRAVEAAAAAIPDDEAAFLELSPEERRSAYDVGVRAQDRLLRGLSRVVEDMARDGADLLGPGGLPRTFTG
jgi:hypothetical protein